jgi:plastocyanin
MKRITLLTILILLTGITAAQPAEDAKIDTVLITSTANYPDTYISEPVSEMLGAPVLLTDKDELRTSTSRSLERFEVEEAVLVGGPEVINEEVEQEINSEVNTTTRLWGTTQTGTSVEVSQYFWSSSEEATVVQYPQDEEGYQLLNEVSEESDENPILISKEGTLSASVLAEVERLGATEVTVYSSNTVNVTQDLEEIGVEDVEIERPEDDEDTSGTETGRTVFVAASNFRDAISAQASRGNVNLVTGEEEINETVETARNSEGDTVYVTGEPELAQQIAERIREETEKEVVLLTGEPEQVSANLTSREAPEWAQEQNQRLPEWRQETSEAPGLQNSANRSIRNAERAVDENSSEEARELLQEARSDYEDEDYFEAKKKATRAHSMARSQSFRRLNPEEVREQVQEEREDFREAAEELRELGEEQAEELREAESMEERLEIIREFREERRQEIRELRRENLEKENRSSFDSERFEQEPGDADENGQSEVKLELEGNEIKAEAEYTAGVAGYTPDFRVNKENNQVTFDLELQSPDNAAQVITNYQMEKRTDIENGSYTATVNLLVDGEQINTVSREIEVPGTLEAESETGGQESENETEDAEEEENIVRYTDQGFTPESITIQQGEEVTWIDESSTPMNVASDNHPTHRNYDGTSRNNHCEDGESETFDQCQPGDEYEFEFEKTGEFGYHNHASAGDTGTVIVE